MLRRFLILGLALSSLLAVALVLVVFALGVRWGGGDSTRVTEKLPSPSGGVLEGGKEFTSEVKGYSIRLPERWSTQPSSVDLERTSTDVFFETPSDGEAGVAPTLTVTKETLPAGIDIDQYLANWLDYLSPASSGMSRPEPLNLAGMQGYLVDYESFSRQQSVQITAAVLVKGDAGWEIVLAVPVGKRAEYRPLLAAILNSFSIR
jgi:hypothetical protein